jgi:hypothetical protein
LIAREFVELHSGIGIGEDEDDIGLAVHDGVI